MGGQVAGTTLSDRQGAARLLAEYLVSVGQPAKALGVYDQLYKMTRRASGRVDVLWRMAIASLRAGNRARAHERAAAGAAPEARFGNRARRDILAGATRRMPQARRRPRKSTWASLAQRYPFSYYGTRAAARIGAPLPAPSIAFPELTLRDAVMAHPDYQAAALLSRAGMLSEAAVYARRLNAAFRRDDAVALLAARASEAAGDYSSSATLMSSYFGPYLQRPATQSAG